MGKVIVFGSLNMDVIVQSDRRPAAGETILGATVSLLPGGKGSNQAIAAARLGAKTEMLGVVGDDAFGGELRAVLKRSGVNNSGVRIQRGMSTGVALIQVAGGDNAITGASGANGAFKAAEVRRAPRRGEVWVGQFETPVAATEALLRKARATGATTILNLAPMVPHPPRLLKFVDIAVLNEIELAQATGARITARSPERTIAAACRKLGARIVIATLGGRGLVMAGPDWVLSLPAFKAKVVDTTGAGDCFVGALAARLSAGVSLSDAARYATAAASCSVERLGAAPAMPTPREVAARLSRA
ncbi:MAG: ribokinase [Proteobacteria bacterium]|nr:ribokinase [Pseudomonadota bacterium]